MVGWVFVLFFFFKWGLGRLGAGVMVIAVCFVHSTNNLETRVFSQGHTVGEDPLTLGI